MIINWSLFVPGLLLLLFPADRLLSTKVQLRSFESFRSLEDSPRFRPWWWVPALWLDPMRALAGTLLLQAAFGVVSKDWMLVETAAYWWIAGILAAAVLSQIITRREPDVLLAPIGFVAGIVAALTSWPVALFGVVAATAGVFAFRQFHAFFTVGFPAVALLGFVLDARVAWIAPALMVLALPLIACTVTGSALELPTRKDAGPLPRPGVAA